MQGTVSNMLPESPWKSLVGAGNTVCQVKVDQGGEYQLRCHYAWTKNLVTFELIDEGGKVLDKRFLTQQFLKSTMDLGVSPSYPLEYLIGGTGKNYFVTPDEKIPGYFKVANSSRSIDVDGMKFTHHDYQSVIHFLCHDDRLVQAVLVASLLFNPPMNQSQG